MTYHYGGYLLPVLGDILAMGRQGMKAREIARALYPKMDTSAAMVHYILQRYNRPQPSNSFYPLRTQDEYREIEHRAKVRNPNWFIYLEPIDEFGNYRIVSFDWTLRAHKGRPIDMGGPRDVWIEQSPWDEV